MNIFLAQIILKTDFHFPMFFSLENQNISRITSLKLVALCGYKRLCIIINSFFSLFKHLHDISVYLNPATFLLKRLQCQDKCLFLAVVSFS